MSDVIKGNYTDYFKIKNVSENVGEIDIYGEISDMLWWGDEVTLQAISEQLKEMGKVNQLDIRINSYGGDVFAGNAIFNVIDNYKKKNKTHITVYNDGIMASMASGIAMVGDEVIMPENTLFMVHKPIASVSGNANDLQRTIELLDKTEVGLISNYMRHFNGTEDELRELLANETWLTAQEAYDYGFCTQIEEANVEIAASAKGLKVGGVVFNTARKADFENKQITITEESEVEIGDMADVVEIMDKVEPAETVEIVDKVEFAEFISKEATFKALGAEHTAEEVLNFAKVGAVDYPELENTLKTLQDTIATLTAEKESYAQKYKKVHEKAVNEALSNGTRAMYDKFDADLWRKILNDFDYDEVLKISDGWAKEADIVMKAGVKVSETKSVLMSDKVDYSSKEYNNI